MSSQLDLTKREIFAILALHALVSSPYDTLGVAGEALQNSQPQSVVAKAAVELADSLLKELEKEEV